MAIGFAVPILAQEQSTVDPEVRQQIEAALIRDHIFHLQFLMFLVVRLTVRSEEALVTDEVCLALPKLLKRSSGLCLRDWVVSESKGLLQQVRGYGKSVFLRDCLLDRTRIIAIDRVVKHLVDKRRQIRRV